MTAAAELEEAAPADVYAEQIRPLLGLARTAFGSQAPDSPARKASDRVNELVLEYSRTGAKMPALAASSISI